MMPWLNPNDVEFVRIEIPFEDIGITTVKDCDTMLEMIDKSETHEETTNSILDYRNHLSKN